MTTPSPDLNVQAGAMQKSTSDPTLLIVNLAVSCAVFILLLIIYRNIYLVRKYYSPDVTPPSELRFGNSFLSGDEKPVTKKS